MKTKRTKAGLLVLILIFGIAPYLTAQEIYEDSTDTSVGIQLSTNFEETMFGVKIQTGDIAITPKIGFFVQTLETPRWTSNSAILGTKKETAFAFAFGSGFDYYLKQGMLRPYVGADILLYLYSCAGTDWWMLLSPHAGAEYWLSDSFSIGGNLGIQIGVGESRYLPNTIGYTSNAEEGNFSFGLAGKFNMTYYF